MSTPSTNQPGVAGATDAAGPDPRRWKALAVLAAAQLMIVLDASIVNIALPSAQEDLGISNADRQWVVTAYTLAFGSLLLLGGRIADYTGRKRTFIIGLLGFAAASALGGIAPNEALLFAARGLQGAFAALMAPAALSIVTVTFTDPKERAKAFGVFGALAGGGAAIGLLVGGILTEYFSWRWCLVVNVPVAILVAVLAVPFVHESKAPGNTAYDIPGVILATGGLFSLVFGFTQAAKSAHPENPNDPTVLGWTHSTTLFFLGLAVVLLVVVLLLGAAREQPPAAAAHPRRPQPRRVVPDVPARRRGPVRDVPVPDLLLPAQPGLQPGQVRVRVPAVQHGHHPHGRRGGPAAATRRATAADDHRALDGRRRDAPADQDRAETRPTGRTSSRPSCC